MDTPKELDQDSGDYFRDPNAAHYPENPIEPAVRALLLQNPNFQIDKIKVFACASTMGSLLRFIQKADKPFRFSVEMVGDTAFFVRRENSPTEKIPNVRGYGHTFPANYCAWEDDVKGSSLHQRLICYNFGGLKCVVRYGSDGYLNTSGSKPIPPLDGYKAHQKSTFGARLNIKTGGQQIPQELLFDLKTRSVKRIEHDTLGEELGRLWLTQTPKFILAHHKYGTFNDIQVSDIQDNVKGWEANNQTSLCQLAILIRRIIEFAKSRDDGKCEVRRQEVEILEIREQTSDVKDVLPPDLSAIWTAGHMEQNSSDGSGESDDSDGQQSEDEHYYSGEEGFPSYESDEESEKDYTACSAEDCGYCGRCRY